MSWADFWSVAKCLFSSEKADASALPTWFKDAAIVSSKANDHDQENQADSLPNEWRNAHFNCGGCITGSEFTSNDESFQDEL